MLLAAPNLSTLSRTVNRTKPFHNYSFSRKRQLNCKLQRQALRGLVVAHALKERNKQDYGDRVLACIPYLLPLLDATHFGKFIFLQYPFVARAMAPLAPLASLYNIVPFAPFLSFLAVHTGIVNNYALTRSIRFNAAQAVLLDILLIVPQAIMNGLLRDPGNDSFSLQAYISANNTVFLFVLVSVVYAMGSALVGQSARLPLVAEAADKQAGRGPF